MVSLKVDAVLFFIGINIVFTEEKGLEKVQGFIRVFNGTGNGSRHTSVLYGCSCS